MSHKEEPASPPLRLIKAPKSEPISYEPDPEVKEMFEDIRRQQGEQKRKCEWCDPGGKDVA